MPECTCNFPALLLGVLYILLGDYAGLPSLIHEVVRLNKIALYWKSLTRNVINVFVVLQRKLHPQTTADRTCNKRETIDFIRLAFGIMVEKTYDCRLFAERIDFELDSIIFLPSTYFNKNRSNSLNISKFTFLRHIDRKHETNEVYTF